MPDMVKFFMSFRGRLMLLLTSFLLLTIILVLALDNWTRKRANEEVQVQSEEVKDAVKEGFSDFATAIGLAIENLSSERYLYKQIEAGEVKLPDTVGHIIVADKNGKVSDTTTLPSRRLTAIATFGSNLNASMIAASTLGLAKGR